MSKSVNRVTEIKSVGRSNIVPADKLRQVQLSTMEDIAKSLAQSYGPYGSTTIIRSGISEKDTGTTSYTKDGHRILCNIKYDRPIELAIVDDLKDVTRNTVKTVGDGTTSAVILSYEIFKSLSNLNTKTRTQYADKQIIEKLADVAKKISEKIESKKQPVNFPNLYNIAYTSTDGNEEVALEIADLYKQFGTGVYIDVGVSNTDKSIVKSYDGITVDSGYFNTSFINNQKDATCEINNAKIYVFEDPIDTPELMTYCYKIILDNILTPYKEFNEAYRQYQTNPSKELQTKMESCTSAVTPTVIFSTGYGRDIRSQMDEVLDMLKSASVNKRPPILLVTNITDMDKLHDLAELSGAKPIKKYIDPETQKQDVEAGIAPTIETISKWFCGAADQVVADSKTTKIVNPKNMFDKNHEYSTLYKGMLESLEAQLKQLDETKSSLTEVYKLRRRINSLKCNMVDYFIGGVAITDRDALKDSVEDAVLNCRNAAQNGIGYAANFEGLRASKELYDEVSDPEANDTLTELVAEAVYSAYRTTMSRIYAPLGKEVAETYVDKSLDEGHPIDIRDPESDGSKVLTSIKSDQVILEAIVKIVGLMFKSNQFLCTSPIYNVYVDD